MPILKPASKEELARRVSEKPEPEKKSKPAAKKAPKSSGKE